MSIFGAVQFKSGGARTASSVSAAAANTALGDLVLVGVGWSDSGTVTGVTDTAGNTYTPLTQRNPGSAGHGLQWFYCTGATHANASNVVTATFSFGTNNYSIIAVWDVTLSGSAAYDTDTATSGSGNATTAIYSTTGTDEFVAVVALDGFGTGGYVAQASYTLDGSFGTFGGAEHIVFSSAQSGITSSFPTHPSTAEAIAVAFKVGVPPAPGRSKSSEMGNPSLATRIESPETSIVGTNLGTKIIG